MKSKLLLTIIGLSLILGTSVSGFASSVLLQWDPNTEPDMAGYKVYYKADSPVLPFDGVGAIEGPAPLDVKNLTTATVSGLDPGRTYYFAVTAYNTAGQESSYSNIVVETIPLSDTTAPIIVSFTIPATSTALTVPITTFSTSDNVGVSGYLLTASAAAIPSASDTGWSATPPTSYTFSSGGSKSLYAWAKDTAGNISNASGRTVIITLPDTIAPSVSAFTIPTTSSTTTVPITTAISQSGYTIADALQALRISVGLITPTKSQFNRLDVAPLFNGKPTPDGKININDALMILSKTVGLTSW